MSAFVIISSRLKGDSVRLPCVEKLVTKIKLIVRAVAQLG